MIFVTVGTHEQGMDRLFMEIDRLIEEGLITDEVFAQIGYANYEPKYFKYEKMISYDEMDAYVKEATIIITHGGPGSIFHPLQYGKIPIVMPRDPKFNEHVDDHQVLFTERLEKEGKVIAVFDIDSLYEKIKEYKILSDKCNKNISGNTEFIEKFSKTIDKILK